MNSASDLYASKRKGCRKKCYIVYNATFVCPVTLFICPVTVPVISFSRALMISSRIYTTYTI